MTKAEERRVCCAAFSNAVLGISKPEPLMLNSGPAFGMPAPTPSGPGGSGG